MSIQKKSLISTLKTTKKANLASAPVGKKTASMGHLKISAKKTLVPKTLSTMKRLPVA